VSLAFTKLVKGRLLHISFFEELASIASRKLAISDLLLSLSLYFSYFPTSILCYYCHSLGGVVVHPDFASNRWLYLYYTHKNDDNPSDPCAHDVSLGPRNIVSRFTVNADLTIDLSSEFTLFRGAPLNDKIHNGGGLQFGVDGMLYITVGDAGYQTEAAAQNASNLFGTVLRITDDGNIPSDNPFVGDGTARCNVNGTVPSGSPNGTICQEIYNTGLRNPFRFTMDLHSTDKVRFLVNDVGGRVWEETNEGGTDFAGANYGWPVLEVGLFVLHRHPREECLIYVYGQAILVSRVAFLFIGPV
jgi:glucose/arabinose dehydrogenase